MAVSSGQTTALEMKMRLREKPLPKLTEELEKLSSASDRDVDLLCAYLDVLEEKDPLFPADRDPAAEYEKFKEAHAELFDAPDLEKEATPTPRKSRPFRFKQLLVSFAAIFCLLIIVAEANGAGIVGRLIEWGAETFSLRPASGAMELKTAEENGFRSLQEAFDFYEVDNPAIPTWIPERFTIDRVTVLKTDDSTIIGGKYLSGEDELLIRGTADFGEDFTFEDDLADNHFIYTANGIAFILSTNMDEERAVWAANGYSYSAGGNITEAELKQMLDSIQIKE